MKGVIFTKLVALLIITSLFVVSCIPDTFNVNVQATIDAQVGLKQNTLDTLQNAIDAMNQAPGSWDNTMSDLISKLTNSGSTIIDKVQSAYNQALGQTQVTTFCGIDFIGHRLVEQLQAIAFELKSDLHNISGKYPDPGNPPVLLPVVCSTDPVVITTGVTKFIIFYGYNLKSFGLTNFTADLLDSNTSQIVQTNYGSVSITSDYQLVVDIQSPPISPTPQQGLQLILRYKGQQVSDEEKGVSSLSMQFPNMATVTPSLPAITIDHFCEASQEADIPGLTVTVPSGYKVVGGGVFDNFMGAGNMLTASFPSGVNTWTGVGKDHGVVDQASITVCALGLYDPQNLWDVEIFTGQSPDASSHPVAQVSVPNNFTLVGGGAYVDYGSGPGNILYASYPLDASTWVAKSKDHLYTSPAILYVYAIGIAPNAGNPYSKFPDVRIFQGNPDSASNNLLNSSVKVENGYTLLGGGAAIDYTGAGMMLTKLFPLNDYSGWTAIGKAHIQPDSGAITVYALGFKQP